MKIYLEETAFVSMILACCEVYRRESYGALLGYRTDEKAIVTVAIPYQSARRGHSITYLTDRRRQIIDSALDDFPKYRFLGEYHSHPGFRNRKARVGLSRSDLLGVGAEEIQLVVAINDKKRSQGWIQKKDQSLAGTFDRYHINIAGYYTVGSNGTAYGRRATLLCPYAVSLLSLPPLKSA